MKTAIAFVYGKGLAQAPAVEAARGLGLRVVALGPDTTVPAMQQAHEKVRVDLADANAVIAAARAYAPDLVVPGPYGPFVETAGAVIDALGLPGVGLEASHLCEDKREFHNLLQSLGLSTPRQRVATSGAEIRRAMDSIGFPCVLKPRDGVGSRAVMVVREPSEVAYSVGWHLAERQANGFTHSLVEQLVEGKEYGINAVVSGGELVFSSITVKEMTPLPYRQEMAHCVDPALSPFVQERIISAVALVARALKFDKCVMNADVILTPSGDPYILDLTPRIGGFLVSHTLIPATSGVDITSETLRMLMGEKASFHSPINRAGVLRFYPGVTKGLLTNEPDVTRAAAVAGVVHLHCPMRAGWKFADITHSDDAWDRSMIVTSGDTLMEAEAAWRQATSALNLRIDDGTSTLDGLPALLDAEPLGV